MESVSDSLLTPYAQSFDTNVLSVAFHPTEPRLATGGSVDGTAKIWTFIPDRQILAGPVGSSSGQINSVSFNSDGDFLATSSNQEFDARIWSMSNMTVVKTLTVNNRVRPPLSCIAFGQDGYLVTGYTDNTVRLWQFFSDSKTAVCHETLHGHTKYVISLTFHPTLYNIFASGSFDNTAKLWSFSSDGSNIRCVARLLRHTGCVASVAFHPHPRFPLLATGSYDQTAKLWQCSPDYSSVNYIATLTGHTDYVLSVAFHPTVPLLATGSRDMTAKLWRFLRDGTNATCIETITYTQKVRSLSFHPMLPVLAICHDGVDSVTLYDCTKIPTYYEKYMKDMESIHKLNYYNMANAVASKLFKPPPGSGIVPQGPLRAAEKQFTHRIKDEMKQSGRRDGSKQGGKTRYRKRSRKRCKSRSTSKTR